jgi:hypothetical protein
MMRSASARFVEKDFDPGLPQWVLWSNICRLGFCNSSDFSSLGVGFEDFADYFANVPVPSVQIPATSGHLGFVILVSSNVFRRVRVSLLMPLERTVFLVKFFKLPLPLICCHVLHVFNHAITSSVFPSMWKVAIIQPVAKVGTPSGPSDFRTISFISVLSKAFERILHDQVLEHVNGRNLLSDFQSGYRCGLGIALRLLWSELSRI